MSSGTRSASLAVLIGAYVFVAVIGGICWNYTLDFWMAYAGKGDFPFWGAMLIALVPMLGKLSIPAAAPTWALSFFL